jgi:cell division septal protein FtsQ
MTKQKAKKKGKKPGAARRKNTSLALRLRLAGRVVRAALILAALGGCAYALTGYVRETEHLLVRTVRVSGAEILDSGYVAALSGVTKADNLLMLDAEAVAGKVRVEPYVKSCEVRRLFPDLVEIAIEEREPYAALLVGGRTYLIDKERVVLSETAPREAAGLPLLTCLPNLAPPQPGQRLESPELREALAVWDAFSKTDMGRELEVSEIAAPRVDDIQMYCVDLPYEIIWGRGGYEKQAERLNRLWLAEDRDINCWQYLDTRFGETLACR